MAHKINYQKMWNSEGTCYRQEITVSKQEWVDVTIAMKKYAETVYDVLEKGYLQRQIETQGNICFTDLSQRDYIVRFLNIVNEKRYSCSYNTRFKVI